MLARGWGVCLRPGINHAAGVVWAPRLPVVNEGVWAPAWLRLKGLHGLWRLQLAGC